MKSVHLSVLESWRQVVNHCHSDDLGQAVSGALQRSNFSSKPDFLSAISEHALSCSDPVQIEWALRSTTISKTMTRLDKAVLVVNHPFLLPYLARSLDQLPVFSAIRQKDLKFVPNLSWILSNLSGQSMTTAFNDIMSVMTRLLSSTQTEHKREALSTLQILLKQVDLPVLRWHSGLILELLRREVQIRDATYEQIALQVYIQALTRLLPRQRPRGDELFTAIDLVRREISYLALGGTYPSSSPDRPITYLLALRQLVALAGTESVVYLREIVPALFALMENGNNGVKVAAIEVLSMLMRVSWPLVPSHCGKLFEGLCHAAIKHQVSDGSEDVQQHFLAALALLRQLAPGRFNEIALACNHVEIVSDLLKNASTYDSELPRRNDTILLWDNLNVYS